MLSDEMFLIPLDTGPKRPVSETLSFTDAPVVQMIFLANRYTRHISKIYLEQFGVGVMDWRMLVMLAREPECSVAHASRTIGIDKAAVSRCLKRLEKQGLAKVSSIGNDERRKEWVLTQRGGTLHDKILKVSLAEQKKLLAGFSRDEVSSLNDQLSQLLDNLQDLTG